MSTAITKAAPPSVSEFFTQEQRQIILNSFLNGASEAEATVLLELARVRKLNPITRQIHFVKRWDANKRAEVWSAQVGIDGFRSIAERTGKYDGQDEPEFEYEGKALKLCRVKVWRKDWSRPAVGVAHFTEYAQTKKEGGLTNMWATKPHVMLAKCAEALAFRKAFPEDTAGLYAPEEMPDDAPARTPEIVVNATPPQQMQPTLTQGPVVSGSRATQVREKLAARRTPRVVDVQEGETEQQAEARQAAPSKTWQRIKDLGELYGKDEKAIAGFAKGVLNGKRTGITEQDLERVREALEQEAKIRPPADEPPPHTDTDVIPF